MCKWDYDETREKRISEIYLNLIDIKWIKKTGRMNEKLCREDVLR